MTSTFFPHLPNCFSPSEAPAVPQTQTLCPSLRELSLTEPLALTLSQGCISLKSLGDTNSQDLEDCACLNRVGFLAGRERRGDEWETFIGARTPTIAFGQCLMLWCFQVMADDSHSGLQTLAVGFVFTVVHSLGSPSSAMENKKLYEISISIMITFSFSDMNEKIHRTMGS